MELQKLFVGKRKSISEYSEAGKDLMNSKNCEKINSQRTSCLSSFIKKNVDGKPCLCFKIKLILPCLSHISLAGFRILGYSATEDIIVFIVIKFLVAAGYKSTVHFFIWFYFPLSICALIISPSFFSQFIYSMTNFEYIFLYFNFAQIFCAN